MRSTLCKIGVVKPLLINLGKATVEQANPQQAGCVYAYMAGIIDGEGCITRSSGNVRVQVTSTQRTLCELFLDNFGGSIYEYKGHNNSGRPIYSWQVSGQTSRGVLEATVPYLLLKRNKALWGLDALNASPRERDVLLTKLTTNVPHPSAAATTK